MRIANVALLASTLALSWTPYALAGDTLNAMLAAIADAAKLDGPIVAEGKADIDGVKGKVEDRVVIAERPGADAKAPTSLLVAFEKAETRMLALGPASLHVATNGKAKSAKPGDAVPPSSFTAEDFLPFRPERCAVTRIADMSDEQLTLVCEPKTPPSQYALMVFKFDREKAVPRQILYYKDTNTNLVRQLKCDDFVQVGQAVKVWRPKRMVLQDFKLRTRDELALEWRAEPKIAAEAFDAKAFAAAKLPAAAKAP